MTALVLVAAAAAAQPQPLRVFGDRNQAPWEWLDNGQPRGAAVELHQALARELGRPLAIELTDWASAQRRLLAGEGDLLSQMIPTPEREQRFLFTRPVFSFSFALFVRADEVDRFGTGRDLDGLRIGVVEGGGPQQLLARDHPAARLVPVAHLMDGTQRLRRGDLDALAAPTWTELHLLRQSGIAGVTHLPPFQTLHASLALRRSDTALRAEVDQALDRLEAAGELDRILERWAPRRVYLFSGSNVLYAQVAAGLALFALAALVLATWLLQRGRARLEGEVRQRGEAQLLMRVAMDQQRTLQDITAALGRVVTPEELGQTIARDIAPLVGAPCTHLAELGPAAREWRTLGMGGFDEGCRTRWWRFPAGSPGPLDHALMDGRPVFWSDAAQLAGALPDWMDSCAGSRIVSLYVAPLFESGSEDSRPRPIGALLLAWNQAREFGDDQRRRLDAVVRLVAQALERTRLRRAERVALARQAELHQVGVELAAATSVQDICWHVCSAAMRQLGALHGAVALFPTARGAVDAGAAPQLAYAAQLPPSVAERFAHLAPDTPIPLARAAASGRAEYLEDRASLEAAAPLVREIAALSPVQSLAALPLRADAGDTSRPLGAMAFHFDEPHVFEPEERAFLEGLALLAAHALVRRHLLERLQAGLADSEAERALLDALIEQSPLGVVVVDAPQGRVRRLSRSAAEIWGRAPLGEPLERTALDGRVHAAGSPAPLGPAQWPLARALRHGETVGPERIEFERRDGTRRVLDVWAKPIRDAAAVTVAATAMFSDVTDQVRALARERESALRLALAVESIGIGLWDFDPSTGIVEWTPPLYALLGLPPGDGRERPERFRDLVLAEDRDKVDRSAAEALAGRADYDAVFRIRRPDGELRWLAGRGRLLHDGNGGARRLIGLNFDVTPMMVVQLGLEEAARQKDEFLAMLGHELRNPLAPIANSAQLLARAGDRAEVRNKAVGMIERQVRQLATLVDDLLEVSRVRHGRVDLRLGRIDLAPLVESALDSLRPLAERQRHRLEFSAPPQQLVVQADATRTTQMVVNLVGNAIKYTPEGGRIDVELAREGAMARLDVRDNGVGIAPHFLPQVFELFAQGHGTLERAQGGLGLGLAIVRRLAELHGGSVQAASPGVGQGAIFTLRLPLADA